MGVFTYQSEHVSLIAPERLYKAVVLDSSNIFPKALPNFIKTAETIEGDGGPGSFKKLTLVDGGYAKTKVEVIDVENLVYQYILFEGTDLTDPVEKISYEYKLVANPAGGSIIKATSTYYTKGDEQPPEKFLKAGKERTAGIRKAVEDYLLANPDYN